MSYRSVFEQKLDEEFLGLKIIDCEPVVDPADPHAKVLSVAYTDGKVLVRMPMTRARLVKFRAAIDEALRQDEAPE